MGRMWLKKFINVTEFRIYRLQNFFTSDYTYNISVIFIWSSTRQFDDLIEAPFRKISRFWLHVPYRATILENSPAI